MNYVRESGHFKLSYNIANMHAEYHLKGYIKED